MKKKKKNGNGRPRWCGWTTPDGVDVPAVPCGSVFKGKKEKLEEERNKELRDIRREYERTV